MKEISMFTSLASLAVVGTVHALAVAPAQHVGYGIASQCTNLRFPKNVPASSDTAYWLIGDCLTGADPTTRITSAISLGEKLGNADGKIVWSNFEDQFSGRFYASCSDCRLQAEDATLRCRCKRAWAQPNPVPGIIPATLYLDEHISVYNGHLLSNFSGAPVVPKSPSPYPVPEDFSFRVWGNFTCPGARGAPKEYDPCKVEEASCVEMPRGQLSKNAFPFLFGAGVKCYKPTVYWNDQFYMSKVLQITAEGMWEIEGFADEECKESVMKVYPEEKGTCKPVGEKLVKAIAVRPAFNGS